MVRGFSRALDAVDIWADPDAREDQEREFAGGAEVTAISVTAGDLCSGKRGVVVRFVVRSDHWPVGLGYFTFEQDEVEAEGGVFEDRDAVPAWPPDYNRAHHDIEGPVDGVVKRLVEAHHKGPARVVSVSERDVLDGACLFLVGDLPSRRIKKALWKRIRRLLEQDTEMWIWLALRHPPP